MKTNQTLTRKMGEFEVFQRTSDGMFNATMLLKQWNGYAGQKKEVSKYFENPSTKEFIQAVINEEYPSYAKNGYDKEEADLHTLKLVYAKSRANKGANAGTWMHPLLFIDFAMWINPSFKVKVLKFVYDQLIQYRNQAGDTYREMTSQIARISKDKEAADNIRKVAQSLNIIIYGRHEREIRNKQAEESSMKELTELQKKLTMLIKEGFIKDFNSLKEYIRGLWKAKYQPKEIFE